ncbi:MAG: hypothetical protein HOY71_44560 [Nonomuraea sp.]|nr:hypothetical protein [Nonomuraea sp.]
MKSPAAALLQVPNFPLRLRFEPLEAWPVAARLASAASDLRTRLDARLGHPRERPPWRSAWRDSPLSDVIEDVVHRPLRATALDGLCNTLGFALKPLARHANDLAWHGQHDAYWVAYYDAWQRLSSVRYAPNLRERLDLWITLAGSASWWWPREGVCVLSERPVEVRVEPAQQGRRLHGGDGPAIRFADGWSAYAWHGTRVPAWVATAPTVARINAEPNIEVRRCAIERIGWDAYLDEAGLDLLGTCPDPGNPGAELRLYDLPGFTRVLLAVNGSLERDGRRRRYGLMVPPDVDDPLSAAGWTYGLTGDQYSQLSRRT